MTRKILSIHTEQGITGNFRIRKGVMQCQVRVLVYKCDVDRDFYDIYRDAKPFDHDQARLLSLATKDKTLP